MDATRSIWLEGRLRRLITEHYNLDDLRTLCFDLGLDYDELAGETKTAKTRELILTLKRANRLPDLIDAAQKGRIGVNWPDLTQTVLPSPYQGLFAFTEADAPNFFGREYFTEQLVTAVNQQPFVTIIGPSGSGKSSVVFAGLMPRLREAGGWLIVDTRPGSQPFASLAAALLPFLEPDMTEVDRLIETSKLATALETGSLSLIAITRRILAKSPNAQRLLLVLDQFEELYTLGPSGESRQQFLDTLLAAADTDSTSLTLVLTLRADFISQALNYRPMADALQNNDLKQGPMTRNELHMVIEKPAARLGVSFEVGLVERILDDVGQEPGHLPLLEFTLDLLWHEQDGGQLTHEIYEAIGRVDGALTRYADEVYKALTLAEQSQFRHLFLKLVRPGERTEDTRRLAFRAELPQVSWDLVQEIADTRLVVTNLDPNERETVEVVHETLIRGWSRLQGWIDQDREFLLWQQRLRSGLAEWERMDRDPGTLLRGRPLAEADNWLSAQPNDLSQSEQLFIKESLSRHRQEEARQAAEEKTQVRLRQGVMISLAGGLIVAFILATIAYVNWQQAQDQARQSLARQLIVQAESILQDTSTELVQSVLLAVESLHQAPTIEGEQVLRRGLTLLLPIDATIDHGFPILAIALSPDGERLAASDQTGSVHIWDVNTLEEVAFLGGLGQDTQAVAFSPNGESLAIGSADGLYIWTGISDDPAVRLGEGRVYDVAFSPDGKLLATGNDTEACLWTLAERQRTNCFGQGRNFAVAFNASGRQLATGNNRRQVEIWDVASGTSLQQFTHESWIHDIAFSPGGRRLATVSEDRTVRIWDLVNGQEKSRFSHAGEIVKAVAFSPDGRVLATGSWGQSGLKLWDLETKQEIGRVEHESPVQALTFSPDGRWGVSAGHDGLLHFWRTTNGPEWASLQSTVQTQHTGHVWTLAFTPDSRHLLTGGADAFARLWNVSNGQETASTLHDTNVFSVAVNPTGERIASVSQEAVHVWDSASSRTLFTLTPQSGNTSHFEHMILSPDGRYLATADNRDQVILWNAETGQLIAQHTPDTHGFLDLSSALTNGHVNQFHFSPNSKMLAIGVSDSFLGKESRLELWYLEDDRPVTRLTLDDRMTTLAFSPNGRWLIGGDYTGQVKVWNTANFEHVTTVTHPNQVTALAFSPDSQWVASADASDQVWLWTPANGQINTRFTYEADSLVFSPNDHILAAANRARPEIAMWDIASGTTMTQLTSDEQILDIAFSSDGTWLAGAGSEGTFTIWDTSDWNHSVQVAHEEMDLSTIVPLWQTAFFLDSDRLLSLSPDIAGLEIWNVQTGILLEQWLPLSEDAPVEQAFLCCAALSTNGQWLATLSVVGDISFWDVTSGQEINHWSTAGNIEQFWLTPEGDWLITLSSDGTAQIWNTANSQEVASIYVDNQKESGQLVLSANGSYLFSSTHKYVHGWEIPEGKPLPRISTNSLYAVTDFVAKPDGHQLAIVHLPADLIIWDLVGDQEVARFTLGSSVGPRAMIYSPDGRWLAIEAGEETLLIETQGYTVVNRLPTGQIDSLMFSPDSQLLADVATTGGASIWDVKTGELLHQIEQIPARSQTLFSPDGRWLLTYYSESGGKLWPIEVEDLITQACSRLSRNLKADEEWPRFLPDEPYRQTCP